MASVGERVAAVLADLLASGGGDGLVVKDIDEDTAAVRYSGRSMEAPRRLHECAGRLEDAGFRVERVGFPGWMGSPGWTGMPRGMANGRRDTGGRAVFARDPHLRVRVDE